MRDQFRGLTAMVTGAGSGIGEAAARLLAERGAAVGVLSRTKSEVDRVAAEINGGERDHGGRAIALAADVADDQAMQAAYAQLADFGGGIDIIIANAGINGVRAPLEEIGLDEFDDVLRINQRGTFITLQRGVPYLKKRGGGSIVVISSVNGNTLFNDPGATVYAGTKAAQVAMVKFLAIELAPAKIRINAVCPGTIATEIDDNTHRREDEDVDPGVEFKRGEIPLTGKRPGQPRQVAKLIAFLASDEADHITGEDVYIDGGQALIA